MVLFSSGSAAHAQQYLGTISGEINDASGARVPNAHITVVDEQTHITTGSKSSKVGTYSIPFLQPSTYTVRVNGAGFGQVERTGVQVTTGETKQVNFQLSASDSTVVEVTADKSLLDTESANLGDTFTTKEVTDLPNLGRNSFNLISLSEGVSTVAYTQAKVSQSSQPFGDIATNVSVNGLSGYARVTLNGVPDDPPERNLGRYIGFVPSPEALQEVKVQTALYDAEYGHTNGTLVNAVLRTGTNQYHGAAYYIFQNTYMNSNTWERTKINLPRANDQWNQPGFVLDGPVLIPHLYNGHDKSFFLVAFERIQDVLPQPLTATVPTDKMRQGDFSEILSPTGTCTGIYVCLYNPYSGAVNGLRDVIPNNDLTAFMNPVGKALMAYYPRANTQGDGALGLDDNYVATETSSKDSYYSIAARFDQQINNANKLILTYLRNQRTQLSTNAGFPGAGGPGYIHHRNNEAGSLDWVSMISPKLVLDSRVGGIYHPFSLVHNGYYFDLTTLGFPAALQNELPIPTFPEIDVTSDVPNSIFNGATSAPILTSGASEFSSSAVIEAAEVLSQSADRHSIRYGIDYRMLRWNIVYPTSALGAFYFNRGFTQENGFAADNGQVNAGYGYASLFMGLPYSGTQTTAASLALQQHYYGLFIQDDWRVSPSLTLNVGLRWDMEVPFTERHNEIDNNFCTTCVSPLQAAGLPTLTGGLTFADATHRFPYRRERDHFQPRIGASLRLNPAQVLRVGFGIIYPQTLDVPGTAGFSSSTSYTGTIDGTTPYTTLSDPYPNGLNTPTGRGGGLLTSLGQPIAFENPRRVVPEIWQGSANIQTQFPGQLLFEFGYVGTFARKLPLSKNINALPLSAIGLGSTYLNASVPNPLAGSIPQNATLNAQTIQQYYLLYPYPQFGTVTENGISQGISDYNALHVRINKRMAKSLLLHVNYSWAKVMHSEFIAPTDVHPTRYQDLQSNQIFTATAVYSFPRFEGMRNWERNILGHWQANYIARVNNGQLVANPSGVSALRNPSLGPNQTYAHMFNTCYLDSSGGAHDVNPAETCNAGTAAFQQLASFQPATIHPYMDHVRSKITPIFDASLFKIFQIHASTTFELRGEFFNVFNSVNYAQPTSTLTATNFGSTTMAQANDARIGQLTIRLNF